MPTVAFLVCEDSLASSVALPLEMLNAADAAFRQRHRRATPLITQVLSLHGGAVRTAGGLLLGVDGPAEALQACDLLVLTALWRNPQATVQRHRPLRAWLRQLAERGSLICAVGTGSCLLADAGLLDGRPATTHWYYMDSFARRYPRVKLQRRHLITQAESLYCAGSVNSAADLMVHLIGQLFDTHTARQVEAQFSPEIRRAFERQSYVQGSSGVHHDELVARIQEWMVGHYAEATDLASLCHRFDLSARTLNRRFTQATGQPPLQYLQKLRLDIARELLRDTDLEVGDIAARVGYPDAAYFSRLFRRALQASPNSYRKQVRGKLFTP